MPKDVIVKYSKIHGKGVFALRDFKNGEIVLDWHNAKRLSEEDLKKVPEGKKKYVAFCNRIWVLQSSPAKYVNHSCEPNTFVKDFRDIALRDIKKGEEITSDYSKVPSPNMKMKCDCGSKNCRGIIRSYSKKNHLEQKSI